MMYTKQELKDSNRVLVNLKQYIQDEIMNYCIK